MVNFQLYTFCKLFILSSAWIALVLSKQSYAYGRSSSHTHTFGVGCFTKI